MRYCRTFERQNFMKLVLFDIDGTLVLTGGAGIRAMNRACAELVGHADALSGIPVAGRTDRIILADVVARMDRRSTTSCCDAARSVHRAPARGNPDAGHVPTDEYLGPRGGIKAVMPGIRELLDALQQRRRCLSRAADRQLRGRRAHQARALRPVALLPLRRVRRRRGGSECAGAVRGRARPASWAFRRSHAEHVIVIGDTPHDVACARAVGAIPVAVATGGFSVDELRATGADRVRGSERHARRS